MTQLTCAPYPVVLGEKTFQMSPLTDRDIDSLSNWIRSELIATARLALSDDMTPFERNEILEAAIAKARSVSFGEPSSAPYFKSVDGVARVIFQGVRKNHPKLTFEDFKPLLKTKEAIEASMEVWKELNIPQKHDEGGESNGSAADQAGDLPVPRAAV